MSDHELFRLPVPPGLDVVYLRAEQVRSLILIMLLLAHASIGMINFLCLTHVGHLCGLAGIQFLLRTGIDLTALADSFSRLDAVQLAVMKRLSIKVKHETINYSFINRISKNFK